MFTDARYLRICNKCNKRYWERIKAEENYGSGDNCRAMMDCCFRELLERDRLDNLRFK